MTGAIAAILLGSGSIALLMRMMFVEGRRLKSDAEKTLWKQWLTACCAVVFLLQMIPGVLEILGVVPQGSLSCAGAILCFIIIVRSGHWYCQRLSRLRAQNQLDVDRPEFRLPPNSRTTHLNGF